VSGAPLDVKSPVQILSVVVDQENAYLGISLTQQNLSDWAGGVRRFAKDKGQISRAEFKLLEAIEQFGLSLPARGRALDLGAAPGGWTRVLRQKEQLVTAVDPGQLHESLRKDTAVRHLPITAEKYLTQYPDSYDLIVNDMRLDARDSSRLMVAYAPYLYPHGDGIMTLKLPSASPQDPLNHALNILRQAYQVVQVRHLFHNRFEVTVHLKRKA
jgi:23S rRNA (cytidine2498-2'-O)-methyltransferase